MSTRFFNNSDIPPICKFCGKAYNMANFDMSCVGVGYFRNIRISYYASRICSFRYLMISNRLRLFMYEIYD